MDSSRFFKVAIGAFPPESRVLATAAGQECSRPEPIHFLEPREAKLSTQAEFWPTVQCLRTRSTDGYERQASLRDILILNEPWSVPFVVLLAGEYVVEIIDDIVASLSELEREVYVEFVRENRGLMRFLRARAISYWNCYYRTSHPNRSVYPGLAFLHQLEIWAS